MKKNIIISFLFMVLIIASGCVSTNTPSETIDSFVNAGNLNDYSTCYELMSSDYKKVNTLEDFTENVLNNDDGYYNYRFVDIVEGSEVFLNNTASIEIEVEKYTTSDENSFGITKLVAKHLFGEEDTFIKKIEMINESDGWKITDYYVGLIE